MIRLLACAVLLGLTAPASAQQVLLKRVPTYQNGEHAPAPGVMISQEGELFEMLQSAEVKAGSTHVNIIVRHESGKVLSTIRTNIATYDSEERTGDRVIRTTSKTCSAASFFPIVAGKLYECTAEHEEGGERHYSKSTFVFRSVADRAGYCALQESDGPNIYAVFDDCYTADGKWITLSRILKYEQKRKA